MNLIKKKSKQRTWIDISSKRTYKWHEKHSISLVIEKCKPKPQWDITSHTRRWREWKTGLIKGWLGGRVSGSFLYIVGNDAEWYSRLGKEFGGTSSPDLPFDLAISFPSIYPRELETMSQKQQECVWLLCSWEPKLGTAPAPPVDEHSGRGGVCLRCTVVRPWKGMKHWYRLRERTPKTVNKGHVWYDSKCMKCWGWKVG